MALKKVIHIPCCIPGYYPAISRKHIINKIDIYLSINLVKEHLLHTIVEGFCRGIEHILKRMSVTSGKYEHAIAHPLYVSPEQSLCIIFRIFSNLLKLIYRTYAGFICIFKITEDSLGTNCVLPIRLGEVSSTLV